MLKSENKLNKLQANCICKQCNQINFNRCANATEWVKWYTLNTTLLTLLSSHFIRSFSLDSFFLCSLTLCLLFHHDNQWYTAYSCTTVTKAYRVCIYRWKLTLFSTEFRHHAFVMRIILCSTLFFPHWACLQLFWCSRVVGYS